MVLIFAGLAVIPPNSFDLFPRLFVHKAGLNSIVGEKWANSGPVKIDPGGNCPIFWATNYLRLLKKQVEPKQEFSDMASDWLVAVLPVWIQYLHDHMMTSSNGSIFRVTGHLCGEFTGHWWIPFTKASDMELWFFFDLCLNKRLSKQSWGWWFETPSGL